MVEYGELASADEMLIGLHELTLSLSSHSLKLDISFSWIWLQSRSLLLSGQFQCTFSAVSQSFYKCQFRGDFFFSFFFLF